MLPFFDILGGFANDLSVFNNRIPLCNINERDLMKKWDFCDRPNGLNVIRTHFDLQFGTFFYLLEDRCNVIVWVEKYTFDHKIPRNVFISIIIE